MSTMTFNEYCEEYLDMHVALMSFDQKREAGISFRSMTEKASKPAVVKTYRTMNRSEKMALRRKELGIN